jgi:hypothetical protein
VLSEEKHDKTGVRLEHSSHNFLTQLAQQAQVLTTRKATKKLGLLPYKIRLFQAVKDAITIYGCIFACGFCR